MDDSDKKFANAIIDHAQAMTAAYVEWSKNKTVDEINAKIAPMIDAAQSFFLKVNNG